MREGGRKNHDREDEVVNCAACTGLATSLEVEGHGEKRRADRKKKKKGKKTVTLSEIYCQIHPTYIHKKRNVRYFRWRQVTKAVINRIMVFEKRVYV